MSKMFTKKDLKNGDVVVYRDGSERVVVDDRLIGADGGNYLHAYNDDLTACHHSCEATDIVKVYRGDRLILLAYYDQKDLIYDRQRDAVKEMTFEEVCEKLSYKVMIIPKDEK